jgi:hypothetical protein
VPKSCEVLIASAELLPALAPQAATKGTELLAFSDADALHALEVITKRRPKMVTLERLFAATPRGAALIHRIKADPSLLGLEIRVIGDDAVAAASPAAAAETVVAPLDQRGTRRAPRTRIAAKVDVLVDGNAAALVDLSSVGAQVVSASALKPNQRVRVALNDEAGSVRLNASVAWAKFEIPSGSGPRYRAGLDFVNPDHAAVDAYCARHRA